MAEHVVLARVYIAVAVDECPRCRRPLSQAPMGHDGGISFTVCPGCEEVLRMSEVQATIEED